MSSSTWNHLWFSWNRSLGDSYQGKIYKTLQVLASSTNSKVSLHGTGHPRYEVDRAYRTLLETTFDSVGINLWTKPAWKYRILVISTTFFSCKFVFFCELERAFVFENGVIGQSSLRANWNWDDQDWNRTLGESCQQILGFKAKISYVYY